MFILFVLSRLAFVVTSPLAMTPLSCMYKFLARSLQENENRELATICEFFMVSSLPIVPGVCFIKTFAVCCCASCMIAPTVFSQALKENRYLILSYRLGWACDFPAIHTTSLPTCTDVLI